MGIVEETDTVVENSRGKLTMISSGRPPYLIV